MKNNSIKIGIIAGKKATDAALCKAIQNNFSDTNFFKYKIPVKDWIPWIMKRISDRGIMVLIGNVALAMYLRLQRKYENFIGKSLWLNYRGSVPSWKGIEVKRRFSEDELIKNLAETDLVILLDAFRLSHHFYRKFKGPIFQIVWGSPPEYLGDSGGFWAFAIGDKDRVGVSIVRRSSQFDNFFVLADKKIECDEFENLRTIKIKQVVEMERLLPEKIKSFIGEREETLVKERRTEYCRIFRAPTFREYRRFLKMKRINSFPKNSYSEKQCVIK
ncbi:MAG TPA: hypothetical protein VMX18_04290 [Candidatus Bipolaricaulota bacterium]|nr:hypothetical protein [Candidatus Bipolaricaulota bacterium]